ncbi:Kelch-like protein 4 [Tupaia chinensis]|uniref:Kelch-like protein 4 n=1 Tax=Tupaia chinensis TaxID=246437 RepID=L8Y8S2_TUPCH|nr:Kelch-like protein 4 [Tupaia chinensis]
MSVSGKKEFDVKQILRLRWRWFSHPSQGSPNTGSCLQEVPVNIGRAGACVAVLKLPYTYSYQIE